MNTLRQYTQLMHPKYWLAWLGITLLWLITRLPCRWQIAAGKGIGYILYCFPSKLKQISRTNIQLCFPEQTAAEKKTLLKQSFASLGVGLIEAGMSWWLPEKKLKQIFHINGLEHAEHAFAKGKGIILLSPHFTCLEIIGRLIGTKYQFAVMYRPHKKTFVSFIHDRFRKKNYSLYISRSDMRGLIRTLNNNIAVWYAYDIDGGKKRSVFAPFFGVPTASLTSVSRLAELTGATVLPMGFFRSSDKPSYEINLYPPLDNFPSGDLVLDATRLNAALEHSIRQKPEQYIWQYKRFKTRPDGEPRVY